MLFSNIHDRKMEIQDVTHCHNERPVYEIDTNQLFEWSNPLEVMGEENKPDYPLYHPVIVDIETSAELGQRPILCVVYDKLGKELIIMYSYGYQGYTLNEEKAKSLVENIEYDDLIVTNLSQSNFEYYVLRRINEWNKKADKRNDKHRKSLVAHNTAFDIPMLGSPNDELLESTKIGQQYEMAVQYKDISMVGHRAGQFGQIFQFLDSSNNFESLYIPVGDTMVACQALWIPASLKNASEKLGIEVTKYESEEHGNLNDKYMKYCLNDVWTTYLLYEKLNQRLKDMFGNLPIEHIYSTASIGKFVLKNMGYKRVGYTQEAVSRIAKSYFGGRTDAEITGEIVENQRYTDILSQYPTVSKLTNVWDFMKCVYVSIEQIEVEDLPTVDDLRKPENWQEISDYYVKIKPNGATLPIRTPHLDDTTKVVTSKVHSEHDLQYHYMDILAADLIDSEQKYEIVAAWKVNRNGTQDLQETTVAGVDIKPQDNVMAKSIEARKEIQINQGFKDEKTLSLKIVANSLYGCSAERIVKEIDGEKHDIASKSGFYNPHVAATITAGGRLMLALGESLAHKYNGNMNYCDTDSLILDDSVADRVIEDFELLNPYDGIAGNLQVLEDEKGEIGNLYAVGTKKYIFFNNEGETLEVKEHGLGNYENLRNEEIIKRLWATIISLDQKYNPLNVDTLYEKKLQEPVIWSFTASTRSMREIIDDMTDDFIRYGDWIQSTISFDDSIRYMALNLTEKSDDDLIVKMKCENDTVKEVFTVEFTEMENDNRIKTVRDIVYKFVEDTVKPDERPTVNVTELKTVTKESTNRKEIFTSNLENQFKKNMLHLEYLESQENEEKSLSD